MGRKPFLSLIASALFFVGGASTVFAITTPTAVVCNSGHDKIALIGTNTAIVDGTVTVGLLPEGVAITPDATQAWVTNLLAGTVSVIDLDSKKVLDAISVGPTAYPTSVAIRPDNTEAWVTNGNAGSVSVINIASHIVTATIPVGLSPEAIAITPNNTQAWVCNADGHSISIINMATHQVETLSLVGTPVGIAMTPDNTQAWVTDQANNRVLVYAIDTHDIVDSIPVGNKPEGIAISPDNTQAWVCNGSGDTVSVINISNHSSVTTTSVGTTPRSIAITPDSTQAWESNGDADTVMAIDHTTHLVTHTVKFTKDSKPFGIAITPDQAPTARFTETIKKTTVAFDASASSSPYGRIATYAWDFGDGTPQQTETVPQVSHTYAQDGSFSVTLIVTNTSGTSTKKTFTGQTVSNNGGPSARLSRQITTGFAPSKFKGKTKIREQSKKLFLKTKWTKSSSSTVSRYKIFAHNKKIASISARHDRKYTLRLKPQHFPHKQISKKYKRYLDSKYSIRAVNANGSVSSSTPIHVVR